MSEPDAAFLTLHVSRARLVQWLDGPIRPAATWNDWRHIPGSYYFDSGVRPLQDISDAELTEQVAECDDALRRFASNRAYVRSLLESAEEPHLERCSYDASTRAFVAGSLTYAENLILYMQFLAVARGAADALDADGTGVALIHNYIWEPEERQVALRLGPGPNSTFVGADDEHRAAVALFQPIADEMLAVSAEEDPDKTPPPLDMLDDLG